MKSNWQMLYAVIATAVIAAILLDLQTLYLLGKPLLMISLFMYFYSASKDFPAWRNFVMLALVFSWAGDVLLLSNEMFMGGLAVFFIAHVFYIMAFHNTGSATGTLRLLDALKLLLLGAILIWILYPHLGDMLNPVLAYASVLLSMGLWAHKRRGATPQGSFMLVSGGAILFVISDGLIAVNKFVFAVPGERILVMSTYIAAQYMIIRGLLKHERK